MLTPSQEQELRDYENLFLLGQIFFVTRRETKKMRSYNSTKKRILEILQDQTWMDVPTLARKSGIRPVRRSYTYLAHLEELGLLVRSYSASGKLHYQITPRGVDRLEWLQSQIEHRDATPVSQVAPSSADPLQSFFGSIVSRMRTEK